MLLINRLIVNDYFNLPQPENSMSNMVLCLCLCFQNMLMFCVGDDAFPMRQNLLKPHSSSNLERLLLIFNLRFSRARRIIENAFGILAARFRILCRSILSCLETGENITKAYVALHNYLIANKNFE